MTYNSESKEFGAWRLDLQNINFKLKGQFLHSLKETHFQILFKNNKCSSLINALQYFKNYKPFSNFERNSTDAK